jgi:hypothetical protein
MSRLLKMLADKLGDERADAFLAKARAENTPIATLYERLRYQEKFGADAAEAICAEFKACRDGVTPRPRLIIEDRAAPGRGRRWRHASY